MCPKECGEIAQKARIKTAVLSHIYPPDEPEGGRVEECREVFSGNIILAEDFMRFDLDADPVGISKDGGETTKNA